MKQAAAYAKVLLIMGGVPALAADLGTTPEAIYLWKGRVPKKNLARVIAAVRSRAREKQRMLRALPTEKDLRPDLFPRAAGASKRGRSQTKGVRSGKRKETGESQETSSGGQAKAGQKTDP